MGAARRRALLVGTLLVAAVVASGCSKTDADTTTEVTGTDTTCVLENDVLEAGTIAFAFTNEGDKTSELYVLRANDDIVGEVENVGPGTTRDLTVDLTKGSYRARCKPGQTGDGITVPFTVTGEGGTAQAQPDRTITFDAEDFSYQDLELDDVTAGETIRFEMTNGGEQPHEFEVLDPQEVAVGEVAAVEPGESGGATITFDEPGTYTYQCILVDPKTDQKHTMLGMTGTFEVTSA